MLLNGALRQAVRGDPTAWRNVKNRSCTCGANRFTFASVHAMMTINFEGGEQSDER